MSTKVFIDSHCHFFNLSDVPVYQTLKDVEEQLKGGVSDELKKKILLSPLIVAMLPFLYGYLKNKIEDADYVSKYSAIIKFFESEHVNNMERVVASLDKALGSRYATQVRILVPVIMDFDRNGFIENGSEPKLLLQQKRICDAARNVSAETAGADKTKILPFLGFDPRRFLYANFTEPLEKMEAKTLHSSDNAIGKLDKFLLDNGLFIESGSEKISSTRSIKAQEDLVSFPTGTPIGLKLYPPLGWDIIPWDPEVKQGFVALLTHLVEKEVPMTVHCQRNGTYALGISKEEAYRNNHPKKWRKLIKEFDQELKNIHLNLAHFGGEDGAKDIVVFKEFFNGAEEDDISSDDYNKWDFAKIDKKGWTYHIIRLLKDYPNTYADISAFNYKDDKKAVAALRWILHSDNEGKFKEEGVGEDCKLIDKILWGTDLPMILDDVQDYETYFDLFKEAMTRNGYTKVIKKDKAGPKYQLPSFPDDFNKFVEQITVSNPMKFLFKI